MKPVLWFLGTWWGCAIAHFVLVVVTAVAVGKSTSAAEKGVMALGCLGFLLYLGGSAVFWKMNAGHPHRTVLTVVHVVVQLGTLVTFGFVSLIAFNR